MRKKEIVFSSDEKKELARTGLETGSRIVSFLDIMGFKDMVARQHETRIKEKLEELARFIQENVGEDGDMFSSIFSDSIILFTNKDDKEAFIKLLEVTSLIVEKSISLGLPIKGAIAKGECTVTVGLKPFYFGQPIIDAYSLGENLVLYGVILHNTVEDLASDADCQEIVFDYKVPLKGGFSEHYILNWFGKNKEINKSNLKAIRRTVSDSPRRYIDNTLACMH